MSENNNLETKDTADLEAQETVVLESDETVEQEVLETKKERKKRKSILPKIIVFLILVLFALLGLIVKYFFDSQKPIQENSETVLFKVKGLVLWFVCGLVVFLKQKRLLKIIRM